MDTDLFLVSDGGTEGRATLAQISAGIKATAETLTNKSISGGTNTLSAIPTSAITFSGSTITGITSLDSTALSVGGTTVATQPFAIAQAIALG